MQSLFQASIINTFSGIASMAAGFGSTVLIARLLGAEATGLTAFALWLVFVGYALADRGIPAAVLRYIGQVSTVSGGGPFIVRKMYRTFIWPVLFCTLAFAAYALLLPKSASEGNSAFWLVTTVLFLVYCHSQLAIYAEQGSGDYVSPAKRIVIGCLIQLPAVALGAYYFGVVGAMLGHLVRHFPQSTSIIKFLRKVPPDDEKPVSPQIRKYARNSWISASLGVLVRTRLEFVFLGFFFSLSEVGYFAAGITFASMIYQLALAMTSGLPARFARLKEDGETERLAVTYARALRWMALLLLPISFGGAAVTPELIPLVFGNDFGPAIPTATVLIGLAFTGCLVTLPTSMLLAHERDNVAMLVNVFAAIALVVLNLIFTPMFGGFAAAFIKGAISSVTLVWAFWFCKAYLGLSPGLNQLTRLLVSAAACGGAAWLVLLGISGLPGLLVAIPVGALVYLVCIRVTGAMFQEDIESLRPTLQRLLPTPLAKPAVWIVAQLVPKTH